MALLVSELLYALELASFEVTQNPEKLAAAKKYVYDRLADGRFQPKIAKTFPLDKVADAYKYLESNAQVGKIVITTGN